MVISQHVRAEITTIAPDADVAVIGNGVDIERFDGDRSTYLRQRLKLTDETSILLTVGRNIKKKSLHYAVEALAELLKRGRDVVLVHAEKNGNAEDLSDVARRLGVSDRFFALGEVSYFDMPDVYRSADIFVFPSKTETFGNVTVEAMASRLPCVEFNYEANEDKIVDQQTGYLVAYGDLETLVQRLDLLVCDPALRTQIGTAGHDAVKSGFNWRLVVGRYQDVIDTVASRHPSRRRLIRQIKRVDLLVAPSEPRAAESADREGVDSGSKENRSKAADWSSPGFVDSHGLQTPASHGRSFRS